MKLRLPSSWLRPVVGVRAVPGMPTSELFTLASRSVSCDTVRYAMPAVTEPLTVNWPPAAASSSAWHASVPDANSTKADRRFAIG